MKRQIIALLMAIFSLAHSPINGAWNPLPYLRRLYPQTQQRLARFFSPQARPQPTPFASRGTPNFSPNASPLASSMLRQPQPSPWTASRQYSQIFSRQPGYSAALGTQAFPSMQARPFTSWFKEFLPGKQPKTVTFFDNELDVTKKIVKTEEDWREEEKIREQERRKRWHEEDRIRLKENILYKIDRLLSEGFTSWDIDMIKRSAQLMRDNKYRLPVAGPTLDDLIDEKNLHKRKLEDLKRLEDEINDYLEPGEPSLEIDSHLTKIGIKNLEELKSINKDLELMLSHFAEMRKKAF